MCPEEREKLKKQVSPQEQGGGWMHKQDSTSFRYETRSNRNSCQYSNLFSQ